MDPATPSADHPKPLPQLPGPKLAPFTPTAHAEIEFIHELGDPTVDLDSFVWKVRINGVAPYYALKIFRFNAAARLQTTVGGWLNHKLASDQLYIDYFDPFNAECRAYGRLKQEDYEDLAIRAHGYLLLTPEQEFEVITRSTKTHADDLDPEDNPDPWDRTDEPLVLDRPVHAIVKDLATDDNPFSADQVSDLCSDLENLHKLGILVRDIKIMNYLGGKLVDFSRAWTMPNPSFDRIHPSHLRAQRQRDAHTLQECIIDWGLECRWNWDEVDSWKELGACACGQSENDGYGADPRRYDWRKWEDDLEAVDAFLEHELYAPGPYQRI
ncbi:kinetochore Sim4 complex subunit FTA2-domain-containing protein [Chaetomium fimeti]|uniref:Kinetochore Sim4 complex subunit FTA2-domain-containing protein n=1 Tax=Chaetomium fimeti TaxID=1854472 RepID=A0AAE0LRE7_9PEZI|nr:kinetochore Sim4 complex subunit FTA2-domain-containing protein [Chaetomium fimeti]